MKTALPRFIIIAGTCLLFGCSSEEKPSDKLLSDYKKQQLDKAKQVEQQMHQRIDNLDQQLKTLEEKPEDEPLL